MRPPATMPATLDALALSLINVDPVTVRRLAEFARGSRHPFREIVDPALELLGGVVPDWPLLSEWNRWCLASGRASSSGSRRGATCPNARASKPSSTRS